VWLEGQAVHLSKKEFGLVRMLASEPSRTFTRDELLREVWGFRSPGATRTLDTHAYRLRQKLSGGRVAFVINVWGVGYRLCDGGIAAGGAPWAARHQGAGR
jgi:DNA-binding response OmpR family regulator